MKTFNRFFSDYSLFVMIFLGCVFFLKKPHLNWDTLAYIGCVIELDGKPKTDIHHETYQVLNKVSNERKYFLQSTGSYQKEMTSSAEGFYQQLPFYRVKPLYILACYISHRLGVPLPEAMVIPSVISFLLTGVMLYYWLKTYILNIIAWGVTLCFIFNPSVMLVARLATPDGLSMSLTFISTYFLLEKHNSLYFSFFSFLAILTRPDNIIFTILLTLAYLLFLSKERRTLKSYLPLVTSFVAYAAIKIIFDNYPWFTLYYHTFVEKLSYPAEFELKFSLETYLDELVKGILSLQYSFTYLPIFILIIFISIRNDVTKTSSLLFLVSISVFIAILVRFILFPSFSDRFYIIYYLISVILLVKSLPKRHSPNLI